MGLCAAGKQEARGQSRGQGAEATELAPRWAKYMRWTRPDPTGARLAIGLLPLRLILYCVTATFLLVTLLDASSAGVGSSEMLRGGV